MQWCLSLCIGALLTDAVCSGALLLEGFQLPAPSEASKVVLGAAAGSAFMRISEMFLERSSEPLPTSLPHSLSAPSSHSLSARQCLTPPESQVHLQYIHYNTFILYTALFNPCRPPLTALIAGMNTSSARFRGV